MGGWYSATLLRKRLFAALAAAAFLFIAVCTRFFFVQILSGERLRGMALGQWTREIPVVAARGDIEDRNGVLLAGSAAGYSVFVRPNAVRDKPAAASVLARLFGLDEAELLAELRSARVSEFAVVRHADKESVVRLEEYDLPGVYYARDDVRIYPFGSLLSRVLGFTSVDGTGLTGLEKYYDKYLRGQDGEIAQPTDLVGAEVEGEAVYYPATDGRTLCLTIDYAIQAAAEAAMERVYAQYSPVTAQCIVLDPDNFDILAMAEAPGYDLNNVPRDDADALAFLSRNNLVSDIYEPGSTFKIVTAAANIEEYLRGNPAAFSRTHVFNSSRTRSVDGTTVRCWSTHANGRHTGQTLAEALNNSCNPCFTDIALALGTETFYEYLEKFHFGSATGIDFAPARKRGARLRPRAHRVRADGRGHGAAARLRGRVGGQRRLLLPPAAGARDPLGGRKAAGGDRPRPAQPHDRRGGVARARLPARGGGRGRQRQPRVYRGVQGGRQDGHRPEV